MDEPHAEKLVNKLAGKSPQERRHVFFQLAYVVQNKLHSSRISYEVGLHTLCLYADEALSEHLFTQQFTGGILQG
jgi:hypothetical protein